jgi:putative ABC transport system permease protein
MITEYTGVAVGFLQFAPISELILIPGLVLLASLVGFLPALAAYRTDVGKALTATP